MAAQKFYPTLSDILPINKIPDSLGFVKAGLSSFFDRLYFRDLQFVKTVDGGFYSLTVIGIGNLGIEIPGTGFALRLNPTAAGGSSEIPVTLDFRWGILQYIKDFSQGDVLQGAPQFFDLALDVLGLSDEDILYEAVYNHVAGFIDYPEFNNVVNIDHVKTLVLNINSHYNLSGNNLIPNPVAADVDTAITEVVESIYANAVLQISSLTLTRVVYEVYVSNTDDENAKVNIDTLFRRQFGKSAIDFALDLVIPRITATTELSIGLEFPRSILIPVDTNGELMAEPAVSVVKVGPAIFSYSTELGISINANISGSLNYPAQIGATGFIVNFTNVKIDLSDKTNIPEAEADGRGVDFKGIYLQQASISFPKYWNIAGGASIFGRNLLIGTEGGISGTIGFDAGQTLKANLFGLDITLNEFSVSFHQNRIIASSITGTLSLENKSITLTGSYTDDGFSLIASLSAPIEVSIGNQLKASISALRFDRYNSDDSFAMGIQGSLKFLSKDIPLVGDLLPDEILVQQLLVSSKGGIRDFDVSVKWKNDNDTIVLNADSGGIELTIPVNKTIGGTLVVDVLKASLLNKGPEGAEMRILIDGSLKIGIVDAVVTGFGVKTDVVFDEDNGDIGPISFSAVGVVFPNGIGVNIDSGGIKGGGFLTFDFTKGLFSGVFFLSINNKFSVTAIGLLATKLPGGQKGSSLLVLINSTFTPPIQLGYGFTLNGIGGLLGIHRTTNTQALRNAVQTGAIGRIMFPVDPVKNAALVLSDLQSVFPVQQNKYLIGFMAKIGYAGFITGDIGLILDIPEPYKVVMLGSLRCELPSPSTALLQLRVDFAGILEFDPFYITFDASLVNSRIMNYTLTGDFAFRLKGGNNPNFLITAGGFHPQYTPPPLSLPRVFRRLSIGLSSGDNVTLTATSYFALTSNSVQFGASVYARATSGGASAEGGFSFDALFFFNPFRFHISVSVSFAIKYKRFNLCSGGVKLSLAGPTPWKANGEVRFRVLRINFTVSFNKTWGNNPPAQSLPDVRVLPLLTEALKDRSNWNSDLVVKDDDQVSYREIKAGTDIIVGPTAILQVNQKVVPFNIGITRFGNGKPVEKPAKFSISKVTIGSVQVPQVNYIKDFFAPSLFKEMTDTEKLKSASFQKLDSGLRFTQQFDKTVGGKAVHRDIGYETIVIDSQRVKRGDLTAELAALSIGFADDNPSSSSPFSSNFSVKPANQKISFLDEEYVVVSKDTLSNMTPTVKFTSKLEAQEAILDMISLNPNLEDTLQVLPKYVSGC